MGRVQCTDEFFIKRLISKKEKKRKEKKERKKRLIRFNEFFYFPFHDS